jgi:hypothetical protein
VTVNDVTFRNGSFGLSERAIVVESFSRENDARRPCLRFIKLAELVTPVLYVLSVFGIDERVLPK